MLSKFASKFFGCVRIPHSDGFDPKDDGVWSKALGNHCYGDFSMANAQGNYFNEDRCQVETGSRATFVGVYDGHGGFEASEFVRQRLFSSLIRLAREQEGMSDEIIKRAFATTEKEFMEYVRATRNERPLVVTIGTCVLIGLIWQEMFYVANLGDSRAVMGSLNQHNRIVSQQLTQDHNVLSVDVRNEMVQLYPDDPNIVVEARGSWRVKGLIEITRSIGDAHMKRREFALGSRYARYELTGPFIRGVISPVPTVTARALRHNDRFVIFASDGLWNLISNERAVEIVHKNPRHGIALKLLNEAIKEAASRNNIHLNDLRRIDKLQRRTYHDDITIVILFIDHELFANPKNVPHISVIEHDVNIIRQSDFIRLEGINMRGAAVSVASTSNVGASTSSNIGASP